MDSIVKLEESVVSQIRSHVILNSFEQVVGELLQNSLDAGANDILIKLDLSSLSIYIQDNGTGISPDDLEKVTLQNYTSKLGGGNKKPSMFGYKGEALYALNSISKVTIVSKVESFNSPYKLSWYGGKAVAEIFDTNTTTGYFQIGDLGNHGMVVTASNVFSGIPVRRQQISGSPRVRLVEGIKLAILESLIRNPKVKLQVLLINKEKFQLDELASFNNQHCLSSYSNLLFHLFGLKVKFDPVCARFKDIKVSGIIGAKPISSKKHQYFFINGNPFGIPPEESNKLNNLFTACGFTDDATSNTKTTGKPFYKYPTFLIKVKCAEKRSILQDTAHSNTWGIIVRITEKVITKYLETLGYESGTRVLQPTPSPFASPAKRRADKFILSTKAKLGKLSEVEMGGLVSNRGCIQKVKQLPTVTKKTISKRLSTTPSHCLCHDQEYTLDESLDFTKEHLLPGNYKVIKQLDRKFILVTLKEEQMRIVVLDQHASDERVKVEEYFQEFAQQLRENPGLRLQAPLAFEVTPSELALLDEYLPNFNTFGINYETHESGVTVTHLPLILLNKIAQDADFLKDSLIQHCYDLNDHVKRVRVDLEDWFECSYHLPRIIIELINSKACRSAIMFGDELTHDDMDRLIEKLQHCKLPFQCAHGRPSIVPLARLE
ncbi:DNA mismatch repair protein MLH3 [Candida viswanathii]|uniref:DNA mismatch repair protein MLH3 n=1 Tax=Candida viswanathii TaxID=5486 RepID=A0A367YD82_9ASCO|nr:DNA mismatch repair protein MLH3 [Candida viswanathii]